jgi:hypothetical protein
MHINTRILSSRLERKKLDAYECLSSMASAVSGESHTLPLGSAVYVLLDEGQRGEVTQASCPIYVQRLKW